MSKEFSTEDNPNKLNIADRLTYGIGIGSIIMGVGLISDFAKDLINGKQDWVVGYPGLVLFSGGIALLSTTNRSKNNQAMNVEELNNE